MEIRTLATGSGGNCFIVSDGQTKLMLECGINFKDIQKGLKYNTRAIAGCLITHRHMDHIKGLKGLLAKEIDAYMPAKEVEVLDMQHHRLHPIEPLKQFTIGTWIIMPFDVVHDTEQPVGYLLKSTATGEKLLFATDTKYIKYTFKGISHLLIECNYSHEIIQKQLENGMSLKRVNRTINSHFSLENLLKFLGDCDLSNLKEIRLIHLSDGNSDEALFKQAVTAATGTPVKIEAVRGWN